MPVGEEGEALVQELVEHAPLVGGDDAGADAGQDHGMTVGRQSLDDEQDQGGQPQDDDAAQAAFHIGLVDDVAEQVCRQGGAGGGDAHQGERRRIALPVGERILGQQAPRQGRCPVRVGQLGLEPGCNHAAVLPGRGWFFKENHPCRTGVCPTTWRKRVQKDPVTGRDLNNLAPGVRSGALKNRHCVGRSV